MQMWSLCHPALVLGNVFVSIPQMFMGSFLRLAARRLPCHDHKMTCRPSFFMFSFGNFPRTQTYRVFSHRIQTCSETKLDFSCVSILRQGGNLSRKLFSTFSLTSRSRAQHSEQPVSNNDWLMS
jgi:hypothetical protein